MKAQEYSEMNIIYRPGWSCKNCGLSARVDDRTVPLSSWDELVAIDLAHFEVGKMWANTCARSSRSAVHEQKPASNLYNTCVDDLV